MANEAKRKAGLLSPILITSNNYNELEPEGLSKIDPRQCRLCGVAGDLPIRYEVWALLCELCLKPLFCIAVGYFM